MKKIIGIGNALVDVLIHLDNEHLLEQLKLPKGSMQLIDKIKLSEILAATASITTKRATGGSAANTIKALSKVGEETGYIGKVGRDDTGSFFENECIRSGIRTLLIKDNGSTGTAYTFISPDGQRTFGTFLGVAGTMHEQEIVEDIFPFYDMLYVEGYLVQNHALVESVLATAHKLGLKICLDLGSYNIVTDDRPFFKRIITDYVDVVFANEEESHALTEKTTKESLAEIASYCSIAVVKVGAHGAFAQQGNDVYYSPATAVEKVLDTTGAGDYFAAGFLHALSHDLDIQTGLAMGGILAGHIIQIVGTTLSDENWVCINKELEALSAINNKS